MDLYENRLPKDKNYYGPVLKKDGKQFDYVVGCYYSVTDITKCYDLCFSSFDTLSIYEIEKKNVLDNYVIEIALGIMRETYCEFKNKINILRCKTTSLLNRNLSNENCNLETIIVPENGLLVMPLQVRENHLVIMFADFENHKFYFFDPYETMEYNICSHNFVNIRSTEKKIMCMER